MLAVHAVSQWLHGILTDLDGAVWWIGFAAPWRQKVSAEGRWRVESSISFEQSRLSGLWAFACTLQLWAETVNALAIANRWQGFRHSLRSSVSPRVFSSWIRRELACFDVLRSIWTRARRRLPVIVQRFARSSDPGAAVGRDAGSFPARSGPSARAVFR